MGYGYHFMKMIVESDCDLNATDHHGNTFLHAFMLDFVQEINFTDSFYKEWITTLIDNAVEAVKVLLENGAYPHAKNKQGKCPFDLLRGIKEYKVDLSEIICDYRDLLPGFQENRSNADKIIDRFRDLFAKYDCSWSLKYLTAKKIIDSHIPYIDKLPKSLVKFVDFH